MEIYHNEIHVETIKGRPSYHDMNEALLSTLEQSKIVNGQLVISTPHTTCSLFFEETMHDTNFYGDDYLHIDINNVLETIAPTMKSEGEYNSPGPKHIEFGLGLSDPRYPAEKWVMLNTHAHIRSSMFGSFSVTLIIKDAKPLIGALGRIYFADWDCLRERTRTINFMVMGTT